MRPEDTHPHGNVPETRHPFDLAALRWGPMTADGRHYPLSSERTLGATAALLRRGRDLVAIYLRRRLEPQFRESIMIAAAGADSSRQCNYAHREWARAEGLPDEELEALEGLDFSALDERRWAAFAWAQYYVRSDLGEVPAAVDANLRQHFDAQERADIELAARTMYWLNQTSNSVDALVARTRHQAIPGSKRTAEFVAILLYVVIVPILLLWLGLRQRRNPVSMVRAMAPFFREFEVRGPQTISGPGVRYAGQVDSAVSPG